MFANLLQKIIGKARHKITVSWSDQSVIYNIFRLYELVFGRETGVRIESTTEYIREKERVTLIRKFYTTEAILVHSEIALKQYLKSIVKRMSDTLSFWQWKIDRLIPQFDSLFDSFAPQFAIEGFWTEPATERLPKGYSFAIAFDTFVAGVNGAELNGATYAHTVTGSNPGIASMHNSTPSGDVVTSTTYAGASMTQVTKRFRDGSTLQMLYLYWLGACATGANNVVVTCSVNSDNSRSASSSYSGVSSGAAESSGDNGATSGTALSVTVTTTDAGAVLVGFFQSWDNSTFTNGTNYTARGTTLGSTYGDSVGTSLSPGANAINVTMSSSGPWTGLVMSIATFTTSASSSPVPTLPLMGVGS